MVTPPPAPPPGGLIVDGLDRIKRAMVPGPEFRARAKRATMAAGQAIRHRVTRGAAIWPRLWAWLKWRWRPVGAGVLVTLVVVPAGHWAWNAWDARRLEEAAAVPRTWPTSRMMDSAAVEVQTTCINSVLSYVVVIVPRIAPLTDDSLLTRFERTDRGKVMTDALRERLTAIHLRFEDKDGTPADAFDLAIDDFVRIFSSSEERPASLEARGTGACGPASYLRADTLKVTWTERSP